MMTEGKDVDETILDLANSLVRKTNDRPDTPGRRIIFNVDEVPRLLVNLFEFITSEVIQDESHGINSRADLTITLQTIIDTLEEIMEVPMNHITGIGLTTLNRRHLYDALQIFHNLLTCMNENEEAEPDTEHDEYANEGPTLHKTSENTNVKQLPSARMETMFHEPERKKQRENNRPPRNDRIVGKNVGKANNNNVYQPQRQVRHVESKQAPIISRPKRKPLADLGNTLRGNAVRKENNDRKRDDVRIGNDIKKGNSVRKKSVNCDVFTTSTRQRKHSVVSTKIKKHGLNSPSKVKPFSKTTRVKKGDLSPQTVSLCSSLKLLEEFDYLKRRYKEIQTEIEEHMAKIRELHAEEIRIEHVLNHVQNLSASAKSRKNSRVKRSVSRMR